MLTWIDRAFDTAVETDAAGVFLAMQANPGIDRPVGDPLRVGFESVLERLKQHAALFGRPVVMAHGDTHELIIDMTPVPRRGGISRTSPTPTVPIKSPTIRAIALK
ncbi:MAG: hypothetical protein H0U56_08350 [Methylibium sp.]|uniref:hypothetical protein n=1 Tax=Methylibium sp. TaxID=2067992 RepID=UPI0017FACA22|nr:hypothetical protein [Methylibium sp.]MBA2722894.1 hypothetical protein [Methylibium sp.]MBA3591798.1 hypothetical protein [Methylibium sp.]